MHFIWYFREITYMCTTNSSNFNIKWHFRLQTNNAIIVQDERKTDMTITKLLVCQNCSLKVDFKILSNFSLRKASVILNIYQPNFIL